MKGRATMLRAPAINGGHIMCAEFIVEAEFNAGPRMAAYKRQLFKSFCIPLSTRTPIRL